MNLILEKILRYHRRNRERIGEVELAKQKRIHISNLNRNCLLTELGQFSQRINAFIRSHTQKALYPEDRELLRSLYQYMRQSINDCENPHRKGYDR